MLHRVEELTPLKVWDELASKPDGALVDVRTRAEWMYVGLPDVAKLGKKLIMVEWRLFPSMAVNSEFGTELRNCLGETIPSDLYFICRSGARSREAAESFMQTIKFEMGQTRCVNVAEGFEGDLDHLGRRGQINGWKNSGLSWSQT